MTRWSCDECGSPAWLGHVLSFTREVARRIRRAWFRWRNPPELHVSPYYAPPSLLELIRLHAASFQRVFEAVVNVAFRDVFESGPHGEQLRASRDFSSPPTTP